MEGGGGATPQFRTPTTPPTNWRGGGMGGGVQGGAMGGGGSRRGLGGRAPGGSVGGGGGSRLGELGWWWCSSSVGRLQRPWTPEGDTFGD